MFSEIIKIPKERVTILLGEDGETKKLLEKELEISISVDHEGEVLIEGESLNLFGAKSVIKAIGRGFEPSVAKDLIKDDYVLDVIDISEFSGKSKGTMARLKGRVIGREGKAKKRIEESTGTIICVYGKTVSIIGNGEDTYTARRAVIMLLEGKMHATVSRFLDRSKNEKQREHVKGF